MKIRAVVVDDELRARKRLCRLLGEHPDVEVVGEASDGDGAVAAVLAHRPAVLFLDIQMPGRTGLEAAKLIQQTVPGAMRPMVIFTTAFDQHAVEAFALESTDYLLKPIERSRLSESLRRVRKTVWSAQPATVPPPPPAVEPEDAVMRITAQRGGRLVPLDLADLAAVVVEDTISFGHVPGGKLRLPHTLQELDQQLPAHRFYRVSRAAIVQLDWIEDIRPHESAWVARLKAPVAMDVAVSRRRAKRLRELMEP